jgi:hypothetical protein
LSRIVETSFFNYIKPCGKQPFAFPVKVSMVNGIREIGPHSFQALPISEAKDVLMA